MKRIFIALNIEAGKIMLNTLSSLKSRLSDERINWTKPENIHITLAFLGPTEEKDIRTVSKMLGELCSGFDVFDLALKGTDVFRNYNDPLVLWVGIYPTEDLKRLYSLIIQGLRDSGMIMGEKPFRPHLTLGRIKDINNKVALKSAVEEYQDTIFQKVHVREVVLHESILLATGPVYRAIGKFELRDTKQAGTT